ncbi:MAG: V-type ATP synthase subunit D [Phycisphaerae bacterium]|nr:V-type ATP synthase subunit D [Phycisphaerae bacterium]
MAKKIKLTRPELKRHRDALQRFQRYLPMLKLKQQQLQLMVRNVNVEIREAAAEVQSAHASFEPCRVILTDRAGIDIPALATPEKVNTATENIAGVVVPVFKGVEFPPVSYSLFATPPWVDRALTDMRELNAKQAKLDILKEELRLLNKELDKIIQRVNLFEKVMIPESREAIRRIRIRLGDEMTAAVAQAKIAKDKILKSEAALYTVEHAGKATLPDAPDNLPGENPQQGGAE